MSRAKIAITLDEGVLDRLDRLVARRVLARHAQELPAGQGLL